MTGLTGLIDTFLAGKLTPRLDVLSIKAEAEIGAPGAVLQVAKVENDVRLPSNAALDRLIPGEMLAPGAARAAGAAPEAELSIAARLISAVLADLRGEPGPARGTAALLPTQAMPPAPELAGALAKAVSTSGLFYESHLSQFAAGVRPIDALLAEPQGRWASPRAAQVAAQVATQAVAQVAAQPAGADGALPVTSPAAMQGANLSGLAGEPGVAPLLAAAPEVDRPMASVEKPAAATVDASGASRSPALEQEGPVSAATMAADDGVSRADVARLQAAYRWDEPARPPTRESDAAMSGVSHESAGEHHGAAAIAIATAVAAQSAGPLIHPQGVTLVHQQLDLLATSVFRWSGEAWPGVSMDWSVQEEAADREGGAQKDEAPRRWSTTVSLQLPRLGDVDVRLSLSGQSVQARLVAREAATTALLRADGATVAGRFEAAGLRLEDFQVVEAVPS